MSYTLTDGLTRQQIIDRLVADDIRLMHKASIENDFSFVAYRFEHGFPGYFNMIDDDLVAEWNEIKDDYDYFDQVYEVN
jgi:hypothetical protein|tara:strand:+ start:484 stop:720 length:237 start_codon:yes stop_codon:yes gene_type:complete